MSLILQLGMGGIANTAPHYKPPCYTTVEGQTPTPYPNQECDPSKDAFIHRPPPNPANQTSSLVLQSQPVVHTPSTSDQLPNNNNAHRTYLPLIIRGIQPQVIGYEKPLTAEEFVIYLKNISADPSRSELYKLENRQTRNMLFVISQSAAAEWPNKEELIKWFQTHCDLLLMELNLALASQNLDTSQNPINQIISTVLIVDDSLMPAGRDPNIDLRYAKVRSPNGTEQTVESHISNSDFNGVFFINNNPSKPGRSSYVYVTNVVTDINGNLFLEVRSTIYNIEYKIDLSRLNLPLETIQRLKNTLNTGKDIDWGLIHELIHYLLGLPDIYTFNIIIIYGDTEYIIFNGKIQPGLIFDPFTSEIFEMAESGNNISTPWTERNNWYRQRSQSPFVISAFNIPGPHDAPAQVYLSLHPNGIYGPPVFQGIHAGSIPPLGQTINNTGQSLFLTIQPPHSPEIPIHIPNIMGPLSPAYEQKIDIINLRALQQNHHIVLSPNNRPNLAALSSMIVNQINRANGQTLLLYYIPINRINDVELMGIISNGIIKPSQASSSTQREPKVIYGTRSPKKVRLQKLSQQLKQNGGVISGVVPAIPNLQGNDKRRRLPFNQVQIPAQYRQSSGQRVLQAVKRLQSNGLLR